MGKDMNKYIEKIAKAVRDDSRIKPDTAEYYLLHQTTYPWKKTRNGAGNATYMPKEPQTRQDLKKGYGKSLADSYDDRSKYFNIGGLGGTSLGALVGHLISRKGNKLVGTGLGAGIGALAGITTGSAIDAHRSKPRAKAHEEDLKGMNRDEILAHIQKKINEYGMA